MKLPRNPKLSIEFSVIATILSYMLTIKDLHPGDLLLCRGADKLLDPRNLARQRIRELTSSAYTHVAVYLGEDQIADAVPLKGVTVRGLDDLLKDSEYIVALRQPGAWDDERLSGLRQFVEGLQRAGSRYNYAGIRHFEKNRNQHEQADMAKKLEDFFANQPKDEGFKPDTPFFCSELAVACLVNSGFIDKSAEVFYEPGVHAPGDLARDNTFGFKVGYLSSDPAFVVPDDDPLKAAPDVNEIFRDHPGAHT